MNTGSQAPNKLHSLDRFSLADMIELGADLRRLAARAESMEEAAGEIVRHLYSNLVDPQTGNSCCALVRCFKTHPYSHLEPGLQAITKKSLGSDSTDPALRCLTLLATAGDLPEWNNRHRSAGHQAIPLPSVEIVKQAPMVAQLIQQMGLDIGTVLKPDPALLVDIEQRSFNVFFVPEAVGSAYVPAQSDFVTKHGVKSVLGFGGLLPSGDLFAIIMFSKVSIQKETADMFSTLALGVKLVLLPFVGNKIFSEVR